jgi:hypothetical protein
MSQDKERKERIEGKRETDVSSKSPPAHQHEPKAKLPGREHDVFGVHSLFTATNASIFQCSKFPT